MTSDYSKAVDVWSVGCIFAELLGRKPIFPGDDYIHQLQKIVSKLGTPADADLDFVTSDKARKFMKNAAMARKKVPWAKQYPKADKDALDLLERMLQFNPAKRISVYEALQVRAPLSCLGALFSLPLCLYLYLYLYLYLSISIYLYLSICLSVCLSVCLSSVYTWSLYYI